MKFTANCKNQSDFAQAYPIIEQLVPDIDTFSELAPRDFTDMPGLFIIHKKKFLFSSQYKELYFSFTNRQTLDVAIEFNKDGSIFMLDIKNKDIVNSFSTFKHYNTVSLTNFNNYIKIQFKRDTACIAQFEYYYDDEDMVISKYHINYKEI